MLTDEKRQIFAIFFLMRFVNVIMILFFVFFYLFFTRYYYISVIYLIWHLYAIYMANHGGIRAKCLRKMSWVKPLAEYFPLRLIKTASLDPNKNYIMGSHPHGVFGAGAFWNINTDVNNFDKLYPGISPRMISLDTLIISPSVGDMLMLFGNCTSSKKSLEYVLTKKGKGNLAIIMIGGTKEVALSEPNKMVTIVKDRKGFVKLAITCGADLIPSVTFGETDIFHKSLPSTLKFSWLKKVDEVIKKYTGLSMDITAALTVLINGTLVYIPPRVPIYTVVGKPIEVVQEPNPSEETINFYHNKYIECLGQLFEEYKVKFGHTFKDMQLKIV